MALLENITNIIVHSLVSIPKRIVFMIKMKLGLV